MKILLIIVALATLVFSDEMQRNKILLAEIDILKVKINKLEKTVRNQEISLKSKEVSKNNLNSTKTLMIKKQVLCEEKNSFPKLLMKEEPPSVLSDIEDTYTFEAAAFRLKNDATVYNNINGKEIYIWKKNRSFTSNEKSDSWVQVTGYFIDKQWLPSKEELL